METQTPATLPSSDKEEILVVKLQCVEDTALQFTEFHLRYESKYPHSYTLKANSETTEHYLLWEGKQPPRPTAFDTEVIQHFNKMKWLQDAAVSDSDAFSQTLNFIKINQ